MVGLWRLWLQRGGQWGGGEGGGELGGGLRVRHDEVAVANIVMRLWFVIGASSGG
jgi:hypothetical protein